MKWIVLALFLLAAPALTAWLRTNPPRAHLLWSALSFLPFVISPWHLSIAPFATPVWSGYVKGWEVSLLDVVAFAVVFGSRGRVPQGRFFLPFAAYFAAVVLALFQARFFKFSVGYPLQLARVGLVLFAVARVSMTERGERAILVGLIAGMCLEACYSIVARAGGALQAAGTFGHQNALGYVAHLVVLPAFAMLLAGRWPKAALIGVLASLVAIVLTASRASIAFSGFGMMLTLLLSVAARYSGRKIAVAIFGIVLLGLSAPIAYVALERRAAVQKINLSDGDEQRVAFEKSAKSMLAAKPMGVGPNHYVFIANTEGYNQRAGVSWAAGNLGANVHNSYLLVAAETGYLGLLTMVTLISFSIWLALSTAFRFRQQPGAEVLIGVGVGLIMMAIHSFLEWVFLIYPAQYLFASALGLTIGMRSRFVAEQKRAKQRPTMVARLRPGFDPARDGELLHA